jgi:Co/Zn/Cd efflux system component
MTCDQVNEHTPLISGHSHEHHLKQCSNMMSKVESSANSTKRRLITATTLALVFFFTELIAGYYANSLGKRLICL